MVLLLVICVNGKGFGMMCDDGKKESISFIEHTENFSYSLFRLCSWLLMYVMCHQININNIPAKEICNALNQVALFNIPPVVHFGRGGRYYKYIILSESETDPHLARRKIGWHWRNEEILSERKVPIAPKLLHLKSSALPAQIFAKDCCQKEDH